MIAAQAAGEALGRIFRSLDELVPRTKYIADDHRGGFGVPGRIHQASRFALVAAIRPDPPV